VAYLNTKDVAALNTAQLNSLQSEVLAAFSTAQMPCPEHRATGRLNRQHQTGRLQHQRHAGAERQATARTDHPDGVAGLGADQLVALGARQTAYLTTAQGQRH
jgi:hypothetical protein